jgi:hypothetical protein
MAALSIRLQNGQERLYAVNDAPQVHVDHPAPVIQGQIGNLGYGTDARVIADHIDLAELFQGCRSERCNAGVIRHVSAHAEYAQFLGRPGEAFFLNVRNDDFHAVHQHALGDASADARCTARNDRYPPA